MLPCGRGAAARAVPRPARRLPLELVLAVRSGPLLASRSGLAARPCHRRDARAGLRRSLRSRDGRPVGLSTGAARRRFRQDLPASPALGLAMATRSKLGRRLAQIEQSDGHERCVPRRPVGLTIASLVIVTAGLIGAIQLVRAEARAASPQTPKAADSAPAAVKAGRVFHLQVVGADTGEPVPDADVHLSMAFRDEWRKTDAQGRLDIIRSTGPSDQTFGIDVWGKGRAMQRHYWGLDPDSRSRRKRRSSSTLAKRWAASCKTRRGGPSRGNNPTLESQLQEESSSRDAL